MLEIYLGIDTCFFDSMFRFLLSMAIVPDTGNIACIIGLQNIYASSVFLSILHIFIHNISICLDRSLYVSLSSGSLSMYAIQSDLSVSHPFLFLFCVPIKVEITAQTQRAPRPRRTPPRPEGIPRGETELEGQRTSGPTRARLAMGGSRSPPTGS